MITIKDEREIDLMGHAGHVVGLVHQELAKWLKPGLTTEQVSDFCKKIIRKNGCTPSFLNLYNFPGAVCTSVNDVVVHGIFCPVVICSVGFKCFPNHFGESHRTNQVSIQLQFFL